MYYVIEIIRVFTVCIIVLGRIKRWREYNPILEGKAPSSRGRTWVIRVDNGQDSVSSPSSCIMDVSKGACMRLVE